VKVGERPAPDAAQAGPGSSASERLGLLLRELSDELAPTLGVPAFSGVLVSGIVPSTAAEAAGIKPGDVINEVNLKKVKDMQSFKLALESAAPDRDVLVQYRRGDSNRYVALRAGANR
jgi:serine protease Do